MYYTNIVHNNSPSLGVVYGDGAGQKKLMYCIFQNNQNYLFYINSGFIEVSHSIIDHLSSLFSTNIAVTTEENNSFFKSSTYQMKFFNSLFCNIDNPDRTTDPYLMGSLSETISRTNEVTLRMSLERTIDQTIIETHSNTPNGTPMTTFEKSPTNTIDQTTREMLKETIPRSYNGMLCSNRMNNKREISVIFMFSIIYLTISQ